MSPPSFRHEDTARVVAACVLALATALAVILVFTDGGSAAPSAPFGRDSARGPGAAGDSDSDLPRSGGSSSSGDGGSGASPDAVAPSTQEQLRAVFPFPRRSRPLPVGNRYVPLDGTLEVRIVRADLETVRSFYERELAKLGLESDYLEVTQSGKLVGWGVPYHTDDYQLTGDVDLYDNESGDTPGQITIEARFP